MNEGLVLVNNVSDWSTSRQFEFRNVTALNDFYLPVSTGWMAPSHRKHRSGLLVGVIQPEWATQVSNPSEQL